MTFKLYQAHGLQLFGPILDLLCEDVQQGLKVCIDNDLVALIVQEFPNSHVLNILDHVVTGIDQFEMAAKFLLN